MGQVPRGEGGARQDRLGDQRRGRQRGGGLTGQGLQGSGRGSGGAQEDRDSRGGRSEHVILEKRCLPPHWPTDPPLTPSIILTMKRSSLITLLIVLCVVNLHFKVSCFRK